ncbi:MAG TPA: phosphoribosyltransferase family protein [Bosea sp. (in: a-proteobacteria)]|jgi:adenine phosphoribosyltransferase|uniref:phosphoribosyltransferase family protein n=1 Tax=Bosea sp. (in: a-proteobacteria) TaxID=1871050 RepID=UPI002E126383|nr:phosphoribosyltransferase family protein [Bosea sp. (in: a-proteobacteria)]
MDHDNGRPEAQDGLPELKVRRWSNYPRPGIDFPDVSTFTCNGPLASIAFRELERCLPDDVDLIAGIDVGGIGFAGALALVRGIGFFDIRKVGSLRPDVVRYVMPNYELGSGVALSKGNPLAERSVAVIDDCLMSGKTALASIQLLRRLGARCTTALFVIELEGLGGRAVLEAEGIAVRALRLLPSTRPSPSPI